MLILARHGRTELNRAGCLLGHTDVPLDEEGRLQAAQMGVRLRADEPARILSSPLARARATAQAIAAACGGKVEIDERLIEMDFGAWDRRPMKDLTPEEWNLWRDDPSFRPPGGESWSELRTRLGSFCAEFGEGASEGPTVVVSHVFAIKSAVVWALDVPDTVSWNMLLGVASLTRLKRDRFGWLLTAFNETDHLRMDGT